METKLYTRYPLSSVLIYNATTILHYLLGGIGIIFGYNYSWIGYLVGLLYLAFAFVQMYVLMPFVVCPNCVYYKINGSLCISGLNLISKKIAREGDVGDFSKRGNYPFCHNTLYMAALFFPIIAMIPALILNFSFFLLVVLVLVVGLFLYRFFVVFRKIACIYCRAKQNCPNAVAMGLSESLGSKGDSRHASNSTAW